MTTETDTTPATPPQRVDEYDDGFGFEEQNAEPVPQVSSLIAIIRIIAVLGMGLCISFGLFISLVGLRGLMVGIPILLLAVPCFFGVQWAEKWAQRHSAEQAET